MASPDPRPATATDVHPLLIDLDTGDALSPAAAFTEKVTAQNDRIRVR